MNALVIGGTGFISSRLVEKLRQRDHEVTILTRGKTQPSVTRDRDVRVLTADRRDERGLRKVLMGRSFDVVYDMIAYEADESVLAATIFRGNTSRFIHCSTVSVYMVSQEVQCPITEDQDRTPLMPFFQRNPFGMEYGINKRRCEEILWEAHDAGNFPVTVIRPTFVSGPRDPAKRDFFWIERLLDGGPLLVPGSGDCAFQNVFVDDVAEAFCLAAETEKAVGQAYNVAAEEVFSLNEYLALLSRLLGTHSRIVHIPQDVFDTLPFSTSNEGDVFPFNTRRTAIFSLEKIKADLGYRPTPARRWLPETIEWYRNNDRGTSPGYARRREEIETAELWSGWKRGKNEKVNP